MADEGAEVLNANVLRMYPTDVSDPLIDDPKVGTKYTFFLKNIENFGSVLNFLKKN